jgi:hypothetical protein
VTLSQTAFIFAEAVENQPIALSIGSTSTFTLVPTALPVGAPVPGAPAIRPNAGPITVAVKSSNASSLSVPNPTVSFAGGNQQAQVAVKALSPGAATLSLSGSAYLFNTTESALNLVVK